MALKADLNGVVKGKFKIPSRVQAGSKLVEFYGVNGGGNATAVFIGSGEVITTVKKEVTVNKFEYLDPLAQTFVLSTPRQLSSIDLSFVSVGKEEVIVQIRSTSVGFPTQEILCEGRVKAKNIVKGSWTNIKFDKPFFGKNNIEYSIVVMSNDPITSCSISELGQYDPGTQSYVTTQPYNVGVLLSSINASTWTPHQTKKLAFRLKARKYTERSKLIDLGTVSVSNVSDIVLSGLMEIPETGSDGQFQITLPDGTTYSMFSQQSLKLTKKITGVIKVSALIRSNGATSAKIIPGSQLITGSIGENGVYVTRAINGNASGSKVQARFLGALPSGSSIKVFWNASGTSNWTLMTAPNAPQLVDDNFGVYEYTFTASDVKASSVRVKIELSGSASSRPQVFNLRVNVI